MIDRRVGMPGLSVLSEPASCIDDATAGLSASSSAKIVPTRAQAARRARPRPSWSARRPPRVIATSARIARTERVVIVGGNGLPQRDQGELFRVKV